MTSHYRRLALASALLLSGGLAAFLIPQAAALRDLLPSWANTLLSTGWWYLLAWIVASACELFIWSRVFGPHSQGVPRQRKLLTDLFAVLVYVGVSIVVAVLIFDQPMAGVFATSGVVAIILGIALQNTLADLFAGLALNIERPFKAGDWITLDGTIQGLVLITNWRSTHIRTRTADELIVPNAVVAKARLTNHMRPAKMHLGNVEVPLLNGFDAEQVQELLRTAALAVPGIAHDPAPIIIIHELQSGQTIWRTYFFTDDFARLVITRGLLSKSIYQTLCNAGLGDLMRHPITPTISHEREGSLK